MLFAALGAKKAIDGIWRAASGFVVMPYLHFTQQSDRQQIQARQKQDGGEDHERTVLRHDVRVMQELLNQQPDLRPRFHSRMLSIPSVPNKCSGRAR